METEISIMSPEQKKELNPRVRKYRAELDALKRELFRAQENFALQKSKETLLGPGAGDEVRGSLTTSKETKGTTARLLNHDERVRAQNDQLENAKKTMYETDKIAFDVLDNLQYQNKVAAGSRGKVSSRVTQFL